jgi:hypothetical protein
LQLATPGLGTPVGVSFSHHFCTPTFAVISLEVKAALRPESRPTSFPPRLRELAQMLSQRTNSVVRAVAMRCTRPLIVVLFFMEVGAAHAAEFSIGSPEVVFTKKQRSSAGGSTWPDGNIGAVYNGDGTYDFYGANGSKPVMTTGTLANPGGSKKSVSITGAPKKAFKYLSGGPVFADPYSNARLMIYHAEEGGGKDFHSVLGMAISTDPEGRTFRDLGVIVRPNLTEGHAEVGGGSFGIVDGHLNVYYTDWMADGTINQVAVARASITDVLTNALAGRGTSFNKYYNGGWTESALGGKSSHVEIGNPGNSWLSISRNDYLDQLVMVSAQGSATGTDLYMATSSDGVNWGPRLPVAVDLGEQFYPSILGTGTDPSHSGKSFYVYYTDSKKGGWGRWGDSQLFRRSITVDPQNPNAIGASSGGPGYSAEWVGVSDFQSDFQGGAPDLGWKYAWNPKGKVGKSADYVPLLWSDSAQTYNTTGGATMAPNPKGHEDDYLSLTVGGGHPGDKKYMPMAGYTIQQDDGAGFYRLTDTSIQLSNSSLLPKEDGVQVLVYVNDTLIGSGQSVLTNGVLTGFDRTVGGLNVGDTVWVMIDPLKNQTDDAFINFDFSLEKLVYSASQQALAFSSQLMQEGAAVPEPGSMALLLIALMAFPRRRRAA